jgi:hypothetical protein
VRKYFLIAAVIFFISLKSFSQAAVSIDCEDHWGAGRYNKVSVSISFTGKGLARVTQDYPVGFDVAGAVSPGGDLSWTGNQLNVVFMNAEPGKTAEFSYYIRPENNMNGPFGMLGEFVIISGGTEKHTLKLPEKTIEIGGTNGLLPEEMKDKPVQQIASEPVKMKVPDAVDYSVKAVFRVQVSASSKVIPESRLRKELDLDRDIKISVVRSANTYKYQAGEFPEYNSATRLLKKLKEKGVKGAFIVAYIQGDQVDVDKARKVK